MLNENKTKEFNEYLEQEGISHDDIINEEIEQEHKEAQERNQEIRIEKGSEKVQQIIEEKMKDPKFFPMSAEFKLETITFVDMTEFNNRTYHPDQVEEARKKYIQQKLADVVYKTTRELQAQVEEKGFYATALDGRAEPFCKGKYFLDALRAKLLTVLASNNSKD